MTIAVNYVWMRRDHQTPHTIPSHLFCRLQQNAALYADTEFRLWEESPKAHEDYALPSNVTPFELNSIPAFSHVPILSSGERGHICAKVDIARLMVLKETLRQPDYDTSIYADFDVADIAITSPKFINRIQKYGAAFGGTVTPDSIKIRTRFENGYMAFTQERFEWLEFALKNALKKAVKGGEEMEDRNYIFQATVNALDTWARKGLVA